MKRFESGNVFQPARQGQGFDPLQLPDITPLLRQNSQAQLQEAKMFADQRMTDLKLEEQAIKYANLLENEEVERLADFSDTLSKTLVAGAKMRNEQVEQAYMMEAYTDLLTPEESATFDEQEQALQDGATVVYDEAGKLEAGGMSTDIINKVRSLSGWAKYGYMRGLIENGGANYGTYFTQAASQLEVTVNGRTFTLDEAQSGPERAAAKAAIAESYLAQYKGASPGLLNKYLFPKMKQWEQQDDLEFAERQRKAFEADKLGELQDNLFTAVNDTNPGAQIESLINLHKGTFGSRGQAISKTLDQLQAMAERGLLTRDQWEQIKAHGMIRADNGRPTTFGELFDGRIQRLQFDKAFRQAEKENRASDKADEQRRLDDLKRRFEEDVKLNGGYGKVPEDLLVRYQREKELITNDSTEWEVTKNFKSALDTDVETQLANTKTLLNQRGTTPYLTESEYARLLPETKLLLPRGVKIMPDSAGMSPSSDNFQEVTKRANALAKRRHKLKGEDLHNSASYYYAENAKKHYNSIYMQEVNAHGDHEKAHYNAMLSMNKLGENPTIVKNPDGTQSQVYEFDAPAVEDMQPNNPVSSVQSARREIVGGADFRNDKLFSLDNKDPFRNNGHKTAIQKLDDWMASGGKGTIPSEFQALASTMRGVSAWDIAERQYYLHKGKQLVIPGSERKIRELHPDSQILLTSHHSPGRTGRAALQAAGGFNKFADLVGFHESSAHGGYNAMNTGGSGIGYNNRAFGSANSVDVFGGDGIQGMTVGEVIELGKQKRIFAAGRYQFIPSTLRMVVAREGIPLDAKFDKNTQDYLFASQVRWRLDYHSKHGGLVKGFRTEWQGLWYARERQILDNLEAFKDSPFNDPQYLHPALLMDKGGA